MTKRVKLTGPSIQTREQMERLVGDICRLTIFVDQTRTIMDARIMDIREEYEQQLGDADQELTQLMALARDWAEAHPEEFSVRKSIEMTHGTVGFRTGQPALKTVAGWTWARVLELLSERYVRVRRDPDKEKLLADREAIGADGLRKLGLRVVQEESFFVEPKRESVEAGAVAP